MSNNRVLRVDRPDFLVLADTMTDRLRLLTFHAPRMVETITYITAEPVYAVESDGVGRSKESTDQLISQAMIEANEDLRQLFGATTLAMIQCNNRLVSQNLPRRAFTVDVAQSITFLPDGRMQAVTSVHCRRTT